MKWVVGTLEGGEEEDKGSEEWKTSKRRGRVEDSVKRIGVG